MKVLQVNAICGALSTGIIMDGIQKCSLAQGIDAYVAYSIAAVPTGEIQKGYRIGNLLDEKLHAALSRIRGRQAYFSVLPTLRFLRYLDRLRPDVVHLHNLHNNYIHLNLLLRYLARHNIATVITLHDCWYFTGGCFHYAHVGCTRWQQGCGHCPKRREDTPAYLCDASASILRDRKKYLTAIPRLYLVGCSRWVAEEAAKSVLKGCDIRYIYNGFDLEVFKPSPSGLAQQLGIEGKRILLGPAGKWLSEINRPALAYFSAAMPQDCVLVLFGAQDTRVPVPERVLLHGFVQDPRELARLYSMAHVFVNCSREDTLSSLNLEAQACGTPVVTYEATGSRETVDGACGFAVETGNYEALWNAARKVLEQGKDAYAQACRKWVEGHFDKNVNYLSYIQLYKNA